MTISIGRYIGIAMIAVLAIGIFAVGVWLVGLLPALGIVGSVAAIVAWISIAVWLLLNPGGDDGMDCE